MQHAPIDDKAIFNVARHIGSPDARAAYLSQVCAADPDARRRVEELLRVHDQARSFLELPAASLLNAATLDGTQVIEPGARIGPYKLLEQIGEGGMGLVFLAEQSEPIRRKVALKVVKPGLDSRQVLARFEAERQALSLMDHPNIAKVLDAGETEGGRPYFVMELVKGRSITEYCDERRLTPRQRLEILLPACHAIQHAHQKGVIHRDVKPSNILVAEYDQQAVPKVIDFGVAKAISQPLTERTMFTSVGQIVGTLEYMSPEQAKVNQLDIDTRSDIYSLGVVLYELLTGTTPFDKSRLQAAAWDEILRILREEEPPKPSTRLSNSGMALAAISANRQTEPARLTKLVRGELDWIAMKALEKDRNRRYETANEFARDIECYLADAPVRACPPSTWRRMHKFIRRNKSLVVPLLIVLVAVLAAVGLGGWVLGERASRQARIEADVTQFVDQAELLYRAGKLPQALAETQKACSVAGNGCGAPGQRAREWRVDLEMAMRLEEIQIESFYFVGPEAWSASFAEAFRDYGIDIATLPIKEAASRIAASRIQADLVLALDNWVPSYWVAAAPEDVALRRRLRSIVDAADPDPWRRRCRRSMDENDLASLREMAATVDPASTHVRSLWALGAALQTAGDLEAASRFLRQVQRMHPDNVSINARLVECLAQLKPTPFDELIGFARAIVAIRPGSPAAYAMLGRQLDGKGRVDKAAAAEAMATFAEAVRRWPDSAFTHYSLGYYLFVPRADYLGAEAELSRAIEIRPNHPLAWSMRGAVRQRRGESDAAIADISQAIKLNPKSAGSYFGRGMVYAATGAVEKAIADFSQAIELKPDHGPSFRERGRVNAKHLQWDLAIADFTRAVELQAYDPALWGDLARAYHAAGQDDQALAILAKSLELDASSVDDWLALADLHVQLGQWRSAIVAFSKVIELHPDWYFVLARRGDAYIALGEREKGLAEFTRWTDLQPAAASAWLERGRAFNRLGEFDLALADLSKAIELDPKSVDSWLLRGAIHRRHGQTNEALADYSSALESMPNCVQAWFERGWTYAELRRWTEAAADFARAAELDPSFPMYARDRAAASLSAGDDVAYRAACQAMLLRFRDTTDPGVAERVAIACVAGPDATLEPAAVVALAEVALELNREWQSGLKGAALYRANQLTQALECFEAKRKASPLGAWDFTFLAMIHHRLGQPDQAREDFDNAARWIVAAKGRRASPETNGQVAWQCWQEEAETLRLFREAEQLLNLPAP